MNELSQLTASTLPAIGLPAMLLNFGLCLLMGFVLRHCYIRWSTALTAKKPVGAILPLLAATVFLVITIVKSSLALSLGLVGALSIVRFRTPIKDPEELLYLFLAIALGLGYGAGQTTVTTVLFALMLVVTLTVLRTRNRLQFDEFQLLLTWDDPAVSVQSITEVLEPHTAHLRMVRIEQSGASANAVFSLSFEDSTTVDEVIESLRGSVNLNRLSLHEMQNL